MKGIVFSEFIEMVEDVFSPEVADKIIEEADLPSGGAYTAVGTYDHQEILSLVTNLSNETGMSIPDLVRTFGTHLASRFTALYPSFFEGTSGTFNFLETIENHVHVEVLKLYPDAELPTFTTVNDDGVNMTMIYKSRRPFADLAEGLIRGCATHFGDDISIERDDSKEGDTFVTVFKMTKNN